MEDLARAMEAPPAKVKVLMVPLPAQSHLNQLLHLARLIVERGIPVHYAAPAAHIRQARLRVHGWAADDGAMHLLHFHDVPFPDIPSPPPDPNNPHKFPAHLQPLFDAAEPTLRCPLADIIRSLAALTDHLAVVHDVLMSFVAHEAASFPNVKAYAFAGGGVFTSFASLGDNLSTSNAVDELTDEQRQELSRLTVHSAFSLTGCFSDNFVAFMSSQLKYFNLVTGVIFNSHRLTEGKYMDLLTTLENKAQWALGPLSVTNIEAADKAHIQHPCMGWLDKQPPASVIYVSFGTMTSISDEQINELAAGLKQSGHRFLWVLREADRGDIFVDQRRSYQVGEGYENEVKEIGFVARDWVPQVDILAHEAVGGFMSHCGWNSCMESLTMGKPVAAWPMASDQPRNALLLTEILKVGLMVRDWAHWAEVVRAHAIAAPVKRLMASEGNEMRERAHNLGVELRKAHDEGGVSRAELESLIAHIYL